MNRRGFIQSVIAGLAALFLPKKAKAEIRDNAANRTDDKHFKRFEDKRFIRFRGYLFCAHENIILWEKWDKLSESGSGRGGSALVTLPTIDRFRFFKQHQGKLFWVGERETWEIEYQDLDFWYKLSLRRPTNEKD